MKKYLISNWQEELRKSIKTEENLLNTIDPSQNPTHKSTKPTDIFPLKTTSYFAKKIQIATPNDPLFKQIMPSLDELKKYKNYHENPLNEATYNPLPGIIKKYHGRALIIVTGACAIHCRYCFRKNFPYRDKN